MSKQGLESNADLMERALAYMGKALELLDGAEAPADIGAHLDCAIHRLTNVVTAMSTAIPPIPQVPLAF